VGEVSGIEICQDCEYDEGEFHAPLPVFWAEGHGLDEGKFRRAVLDFCLEEERDIPAMGWEDDVKEMWQRNVEVSGGGVEYRRQSEPPMYPGSMQGQETFPITILDLYVPRRGGPKCAVSGCKEPWSSGNPVRVCVEPPKGDEHLVGGSESLTVYMNLCREHQKRMPQPSYRVFMVPVGATIMLPAPDAAVTR
jgi:hypothetical protein